MHMLKVSKHLFLLDLIKLNNLVLTHLSRLLLQVYLNQNKFWNHEIEYSPKFLLNNRIFS